MACTLSKSMNLVPDVWLFNGILQKNLSPFRLFSRAAKYAGFASDILDALFCIMSTLTFSGFMSRRDQNFRQ